MKLHLPRTIFPPDPEAFLVGGAVRDLIRGRHPVDYDLVVRGDPASFAGRMAERIGGRVVLLGKDRFDLYRIAARRICIDIAALHEGGLDCDLLSRDFTINALALRLDEPQIIDRTGGLEDLRRGVIRMISQRSLSTDPIRLLRAYRLASDLGFQIEPQTCAAIDRHAALIQSTAGERIWNEWQRILSNPSSHRQVQAMAATHLLDALFPELTALRGCRQNQYHGFDVFEHTLAAYGALEHAMQEDDPLLPAESRPYLRDLTPADGCILKLALLLHDIGKPASRSRDAGGNVHFYGHAARSALAADLALRRLRVPNRHRNGAGFLIKHHQRPLALFLAGSPKAEGRFFRLCESRTPLVILHAIADTRGKSPIMNPSQQLQIDYFKELMRRFFTDAHPKLNKPALVDGRDLIDRFGLPPSPLFKKLLDGVADARLAGLINTRSEALRWVEAYLHNRPHNAF